MILPYSKMYLIRTQNINIYAIKYYWNYYNYVAGNLKYAIIYLPLKLCVSRKIIHLRGKHLSL
jgi:hypothetical protein